MINGRVRANRSGNAKRWALLVAAAAFLGLGASTTQAADPFFDWNAEGTNGNVPTTPGYVTTPTLSDATFAQVQAYLATQQAAGQPLAVKIRGEAPLSDAHISQIYNQFNIKYTFADYEGPTALAQTKNLTTLIAGATGPTGTGNSFLNNTSYVSNFGMAPIAADNTHPFSTTNTYTSGNSGNEPYFTTTEFRAAGVNMASESLYPGDASFRNPINGTNTATNGSTAPNILSSMFTLPILRMSYAAPNLGVGQVHIPYVARFNNADNPSFSNVTLASGQKGFSTTTGGTIGSAALPVAGQLLSRDDFEALILHYRMRGASSYQILDPGVVGYTQAQEEADAAAGWNGPVSGSTSLVASVFAGTNPRATSLPTLITEDGTLKTIESAGVVWSGVTNDNTTGTGLAILVSNLDTNADGSVKNHNISFSTRINGATLTYNFNTAGPHTLLRFTKTGGTWTLQNNDPVFNDPNLNSRDGIGVPEPTSLSLIALGGLGVLVRRRRKA